MRTLIRFVFFAAASVFAFSQVCLAESRTWCRTAELSVRPLKAGASAGTIVQMFAVSNRTNTSCFLGGFPSLEALDSHKKPLPQAAFHRLAGAFGQEPQPATPARFLLEPGREMWFELILTQAAPYRGEMEDRSSCHKSDNLLVVPPHNRKPIVINFPLQACNPLRYTALFLPLPRW